MNANARAIRLRELYSLSTRIAAEIAAIEAEVANEIEAMKKARDAAASAGIKVRRRLATCGTDSGYYRHVRITKTPACDACKLAHRTAEAIREQARRERNAG